MASFLVNGWPAQSVDSGDRGLMYGDGVFRTLIVRSGRACNWARQVRLLARDCARIGLTSQDEATLRTEVGRVAPGDAIVKIIVTRGSSGRGYAFEEGVPATRIVAAYAGGPPDGSASRQGLRLRRCDLRLAIQPRLAGVKTLNRLENVMARAEWRDPAIDEGLLADSEGRLVEATASNVFLTRGDTLVTPDLSRCGVCGAQRERVLDFARARGIACEVRDVTFDELGDAGEVFLTNSVAGLRPVIAFETLRWPPGPVADLLRGLVEDDDAAAT